MLLLVFFTAPYPRGVIKAFLLASLISGRVLITGLVSAPVASVVLPKRVISKFLSSVTAVTVAL